LDRDSSSQDSTAFPLTLGSRAVYVDPFSKDAFGRAHPIITEKKSREGSLKIKVRRFTRSKKFKFWVGKTTYVFSKSEIKRLLTDKLKRSANLHAPLYRCRIFKKCNNYKKRKNSNKQKRKRTQNRTIKGTKRKGNGRNKKRNKKRKNGTTHEKRKKFNRAGGLKIKKKKGGSGETKKIISKKETGLFRGVQIFGM